MYDMSALTSSSPRLPIPGYMMTRTLEQTPQIARVWQAKSLVGLAPASIYADVFLFATSVIYHVLKKNPIRAYGESVIVLLQTMVMVGLLWRFGTDDNVGAAAQNGNASSSSSSSSAARAVVVDGVDGDIDPANKKKKVRGGGLVGKVSIVAGTVAASLLCWQYLPESMWGLLVIVSTPAILAVQLPQIWKNWRQKHTGELATLTVFLAFLGSSVRIGTTIAVRLIVPFEARSRFVRGQTTWKQECQGTGQDA